MAREKLDILIREYQPGDEQGLLEGFNRVFGAIDPHFEPRSMELWRWRYQQNPAGWRIWLAFHPDGGVIGQQAGIPAKVMHDGREVHWNHVGDTFTDPAFSRALRNPGLFYHVAKPYSDHYGGAPPEQDPILYGLPTRRALRIGQRQLGYEVVRNQNKLCARVAGLDLAAAPGIEVEEVESVPEDVITLSQRLAEEKGALIIRDASYLNWRFKEHPEIDYAVAIARRTGGKREPLGLAVYRQSAFDGREDALICDWLVPAGENEAARALFAWLHSRAVADHMEFLTGMYPESCEASLVHQRHGFRLEATQYYCVGRCYAGPYDMPWLYWNWYYTLGDYDLC